MAHLKNRSRTIPFDWPVGTSPVARRKMEQMAKDAVPNGSPFMQARWLQKNAWGIMIAREMRTRRIGDREIVDGD